MILSMVESGRPKSVRATSLSVIITGGAMVTTNLLQKLRKLLPGKYIFQAYGQTEVIGYITLFKVRDEKEVQMLNEKSQSVGTPVPGFTYKVEMTFLITYLV